MFDFDKIVEKSTNETVENFTPTMSLNEIKDFFDKKFDRIEDKSHSILPKENGAWDGEVGDSKWIPDENHTPIGKGTNPENKTWGEILEDNHIDGIEFKDGEPDFSPVCHGEVEIDGFSDDRQKNYTKADIELANERDCTPREAVQYRKENNLTWHECKDQKTMQLVPASVHGNISHSGGISEAKKEKNNG